MTPSTTFTRCDVMYREPPRSLQAPSEPPESPRERLLALQNAVITTLIDPEFLEPSASSPVNGPLTGVDPERLTLLARFAHGKRITKVEATMPVTCSLIGDPSSWDRAFARAHPAVDARNVANALQFYAFLRRMWRTKPPVQVLLPDVASCEIALAILTHRPVPAPARLAREGSIGSSSDIWARRAPGVRLRVTTAEVQLLLTGERPEGALSNSAWLVVTKSGRTGKPSILALHHDAFELVRALNDWHLLGAAQRLGDVLPVLELLERHGVLECRVSPSAV
jgi:hypothetical protein